MLRSLVRTHPMGSPSTGSKVQTTMSLTRGKHQQSLSAGASLQLEKLEQVENARSAEKLPLSPRATEEQAIAVKRRTRSSQGLELNDGALGAEERKPLSSISVGGHRRGRSGSGSPRAKGMCSSPVTGKYAPAKIATSSLHSPTKLERSMSLSRVAHRVVPDADGRTPRSRTEAALPELKQPDSQRELETRLHTVTAHISENGFSTSPLLEKKVKSDKAQTNAVPLSCNGPGAPLASNGDVEDLHSETAEVASHGSTEDFGECLCSNGVHLPVKDIHPVCFETTNNQALAVPEDMSHELLPEIARSCSLSTAASTQEEPHLSNCNGPELAHLLLDQQSEDLSNGTHTRNSHRISHPDVLPTSNLSPAGLDLSYQDIKEVTLPRTFEAVRNQESEVEKNAHSSDLTKAAILSSLVCEKNSVLLPEESKPSHDKDVKEFQFSAEKKVGLTKSTSFELGEKKTKIRKRRRSVSASGIGGMLLKIVRTSEPEHIEARPLPRAEPEVSEASPLPTTANLPQHAQLETEPTDVEAVGMEVEYEDCSSELAAAADTDTVCAEDFSENKNPSPEEMKLQLVDETQTAREEGPALHDSQEKDQIAGSFNDECDKRVLSSRNCNSCEDPQERFLDAMDKSLDRNNSFESIEASSPIGKPPREFANQEALLNGSQRRRRHGSRGRMSHDLDSSAVAIEENRRSLSLVDENLCMITNLERSRSFASMLQVSPRQSVDGSAQAPSSIAILTNPSFSSSHQDRLWEEQAEYSSGGRGTPGRDDDDEAHTPSPSGAVSSDDALRKSHERDMSSLSCSGFASDSSRNHKLLGQSEKKRGRPQRSPLRSLLDAEDDEPPVRPSDRRSATTS